MEPQQIKSQLQWSLNFLTNDLLKCFVPYSSSVICPSLPPLQPLSLFIFSIGLEGRTCTFVRRDSSIHRVRQSMNPAKNRKTISTFLWFFPFAYSRSPERGTVHWAGSWFTLLVVNVQLRFIKLFLNSFKYWVTCSHQRILHGSSRLCFGFWLIWILSQPLWRNYRILPSFTSFYIPGWRLCRGSNLNIEYTFRLRGTISHSVQNNCKWDSERIVNICFSQSKNTPCQSQFSSAVCPPSSLPFSLAYFLAAFLSVKSQACRHQTAKYARR